MTCTRYIYINSLYVYVCVCVSVYIQSYLLDTNSHKCTRKYLD